MHHKPQRPLVLASSSATRRKQLRRLDIPFISRSPDIDETPTKGESAAALVSRLAVAKAEALQSSFPGSLIIAGDQTAAFDGRFLAKPGDRDTALSQLRNQSGRELEFLSSLIVLDSDTGRAYDGIATVSVRFRELDEHEIQSYVDIDRPFDCAGSFRAEGAGIGLFEWIRSDDPSAITGMPLILLVSLLRRHGFSTLQA